jgi:prepilin peptidase CpaA
MRLPVLLAVVSIGLCACTTDLRRGRIPNVLTFGGALAAVAYHLATVGWWGGLSAGGGWLVGAALFFPFFALRGMGGGDLKLLAAFGAWLGPLTVVWAGLYTAIIGGVAALVVALLQGYARQAFANVLALVMFWRVSGIRPLPELTLHAGKGPRLAYALPMTAGALASLWFPLR